MAGPGSGTSNRQQLVVVALAAEDDVVQQYSSDKAPHLTLLYLGENVDFSDDDLAHITEYIEHAASQTSAFGMEVDHRGELGDNKADVLFFVKRWAKNLTKFRDNLLQDERINKLYLSAFQFPEWTPHLTMGFPETPAKKDTREYNRFSYVRFDRIALWTDDSAGPTFQLKTDNDMEVAMSQQQGAAIAADVLEHYGIKGMKWGKHKGEGSGHPASSDSTKATAAGLIAKKSGVKALSNAELKSLVERMKLEQQHTQLQPAKRRTKARKFVADTLSNIGKQQLNMALNQVATQQVAAALAKTKR